MTGAFMGLKILRVRYRYTNTAMMRTTITIGITIASTVGSGIQVPETCELELFVGDFVEPEVEDESGNDGENDGGKIVDEIKDVVVVMRCCNENDVVVGTATIFCGSSNG